MQVVRDSNMRGFHLINCCPGYSTKCVGHVDIYFIRVNPEMEYLGPRVSCLLN